MTPEIHLVTVIGQGKLYVMPKPAAQTLEVAARYFSSLGITHVVSHLEVAEENYLGLSGEREALAAQGIEFISYPIKDMNLPQQPGYSACIDGLFERLQNGCNIAIHCRAGIGRTGMTSSCLLIRDGYESRNAINEVTAARGTTIPDTQEQIDFIHNFASSE